MSKQTSSTEPGNDTPTTPAPEAPATPARVIESGQPVEISFVTGLPKTPATPAATTGEQAQPATTQQATTTEQTKTFTQSEVDSMMANVRRTIKKEMEDVRQKEIEDAKLSEQERLTREKAEVEQHLTATRAELQAERTKIAIINAASAIGLDAEAAIGLVNAKALSFDDTGNATNAADLVKAVADRFPGLLRKSAPTVPVVNPAGSQQPAGRTDDDRRREYFGGGASAFWASGGVKMPTNLD